MRVTGVDGCRAGWVAASSDVDATRCTLAFHASFAELLAVQATSAVIAVDIPIGLSDAAPRAADAALRQFLRGRASSVFPAPCRAALDGTTYADASARSFAASGRKLSRQTYFLLPKIREVDTALRTDPSLRSRVHEVHPETSFAVMNGGRVVMPRKKSVEGLAARLALLPRAYQAAYAAFRPTVPRAAVANDDLVDALAALWSAQRIRAGTALSFPDGAVPRDGCGLPMRVSA